EVQAIIRQDPERLAQMLGTGITAEDIRKYSSNNPVDREDLALKLLKNLWNVKRGDLNIFNAVNKEDRITDLVRTAIGDATGRTLGLSEADTKFAALIPYLMRNW